MERSEKSEGANTLSRAYEERHLAECVEVIRTNTEMYEVEVRRMNAEIKDMYERYHDNDLEIFTELSNTITMNENMKIALAKCLRAMKKPYFGRIDIQEYDGRGKRPQETFYLGKGGVMKDPTHILVVDWRAPIANVYYENGLGECSYLAPGGRKYTIDLQRKRTYEIDGDRLIDFYDSEVVANDELLTKYLAKNKEAVLGEIIATIQKEQNDIIRKSPYRSMIVQGVAGSGKTTVAMHRISYILYNYTKDFKPDDFYIIGSNRILLNYITGVLPELDVHGVRQMTMEQLFVRLLYEDWNEKKYEIAACDTGSVRKGKQAWFLALQEYIDRLEEETIPQDDIYLKDEILFSREQINRYRRDNAVLSIQSKIDGLNERTLVKLRNELTGRDLVYSAEDRRALIREYTGRFGAKKWKKSIFEIYDEFCAAQGMVLGEETDEERKGTDPEKESGEERKGAAPEKEPSEETKGTDPEKESGEERKGAAPEKEPGEEGKGTDPEKKLGEETKGTAPEKEPGEERKGAAPEKESGEERKGTAPEKESGADKFGNTPVKALRAEQGQKASRTSRAGKRMAKEKKRGCDVYDLAALAYIYKRVKETERIREASHIVIDEAQDFGMMAYESLHFCIPRCSWTIMGDVSQNIHFGFGLGDWEELKELILNDPKDTFGVLSKSYRNTVEISDFAQKILRHGSFSSYPIEPIIRHGNPVLAEACRDGESMLLRAVSLLESWQREGLETIAVVCRDADSASVAAQRLGGRIRIEESNLELAEFRQGIMVLPVDYTKGLEFDAVLIWEPTQEDYPEDDGHAKLLYVAATRALHELAILHTGNVSRLLENTEV